MLPSQRSIHADPAGRYRAIRRSPPSSKSKTRYPDRIAVKTTLGRFTYPEVDRTANGLAAGERTFGEFKRYFRPKKFLLCVPCGQFRRVNLAASARAASTRAIVASTMYGTADSGYGATLLTLISHST